MNLAERLKKAAGILENYEHPHCAAACLEAVERLSTLRARKERNPADQAEEEAEVDKLVTGFVDEMFGDDE